MNHQAPKKYRGNTVARDTKREHRNQSSSTYTII